MLAAPLIASIAVGIAWWELRAENERLRVQIATLKRLLARRS